MSLVHELKMLEDGLLSFLYTERREDYITFILYAFVFNSHFSLYIPALIFVLLLCIFFEPACHGLELIHCNYDYNNTRE